MSYILDALKKSDQQRQRGATPTIPPAQAAVAAPGKSFSVYYAVLAVVLLCAGIAIGWLRPWQEAQTVAESSAVSAAIPEQTSPRPVQPVPVEAPVQKLPVPVAPVITQQAPPSPVNTEPEQEALHIYELPSAIQQALPDMTIQLHSYSSKPENSIVSINSRMMKEGESLEPGLRLEQITPDGVIFSYKGYRFQRGIR